MPPASRITRRFTIKKHYNLNQPRDPGDAVVILSGGTVWQNKYTGTGRSGKRNEHEFNSLYRVSDTEIYAGAADGLSNTMVQPGTR